MRTIQRRRELARRVLPEVDAPVADGELAVGCSDGACIYGAPGGMQTNGGCTCLKETDPTRLRRHIQRLTRLVDAALELAPEASLGQLRPRVGGEAALPWHVAMTRIDYPVPSLNRRLANVRGARGHAYRRERDIWVKWFQTSTFKLDTDTTARPREVLGGHRDMRAQTSRRVRFCRGYRAPAKLMDDDNLRGGMKVVLDAMVSAGLLVDDSPAFVQAEYEQAALPLPAPGGKGASTILHVTLWQPC